MQIVAVAKWRGSQIAQIVQGTGSSAWVKLPDLVASSHSITLAQVLPSHTQSTSITPKESRPLLDINELALHITYYTFTDPAFYDLVST